MTTGGAGDAVRAALDAVQARLRLRTALVAGGIALLLAACVLALTQRLGIARPWWPAATVAIMALGLGLRHAASCSRATAAAAIEARDRRFRNALITAEELIAGRQTVSPAVASAIHAQVATWLDTTAPGARGRLAGPAGLALTGVLAMALAALGPSPLLSTNEVRSTGRAASTPERAAAGTFVVRLTPPAYLRREAQVLHSPERIAAVEGTTLEVQALVKTLQAAIDGMPLVVRAREGMRRTSTVLRTSGALDLTLSTAADASRTVRVLVPVTVAPDAHPTVTVRDPGRDLVLDGAVARIDVGIEAADDVGVASLRLRFTTVSGSGEQFAFADGEWPLQITRETPTRWRARGAMDLAPLGLEPGDMVAYRAIARDGRGADGEATSDTYVLRIAQPGDVAAAGFAIDEDENRFALSQQMLLVKTERLHAERARLDPDTFGARSAGLAAEQRMIRSEFVFMLGGEVEDEEAEAAHSHELQEGRLDNRGQRDVLEATRAMSRSERALSDALTGEAIRFEREAIASLQRAFSRSRYLLRAMPVRMQLDVERRLSGDVSQASSWHRRAREFESASRRADLHAVLDGLVALGAGGAAKEAARGDASARALSLADTLLRVGNRSGPLTDAAAALVETARRGREAPDRPMHEPLTRALQAVSAELARIAAPPAPALPYADAAAMGALADALAARPSALPTREGPRP